METKTIYNEFLEAVEDGEFEEIPNSALYRMDFEKAAKNCVKLCDSLLFGFTAFLNDYFHNDGGIIFQKLQPLKRKAGIGNTI